MTSMTPRRIVVVLVVALVAASCTADRSKPSYVSSPALNATSAALLPETVDALPDVDPTTYAQLLAQLEGTPVVVNVWASWCEPCKAEAPALVQAAQKYGAEVQFIGLDVQDVRDSAVQYIRRYQLPFPSLFDPPLAIGTQLGLLGPPGTFFYDRNGTLVDSIRGQISATQLEKSIARILG
jgi:cytochrome c biogenesis protein CcmG/thiol:disulfide interchange protein DsbE